MDLPDDIQIEVIFKSMMAYYISGNHACAYVLSQELEKFSELPLLLKLIFTLMNKNLTETRLIVSDVFNDKKYKEETLLEENLNDDSFF